MRRYVEEVAGRFWLAEVEIGRPAGRSVGAGTARLRRPGRRRRPMRHRRHNPVRQEGSHDAPPDLARAADEGACPGAVRTDVRRLVGEPADLLRVCRTGRKTMSTQADRRTVGRITGRLTLRT